MRKHITTATAAARLKVSQRRVQELCKKGRIPQALQYGRDWIMPENFKVLPSPRGRGRPKKTTPSRGKRG